MPATLVHGKEPVDVEARTLWREGSITHAAGEVKVRRLDTLLCADKISYDDAVKIFRATGSVKFQDNKNNQISGDSVYYSLTQQSGEVENFNIGFADSSLRVGGENLRLEKDVFYAKQVAISSCPKDSLDWQVLVDDADINADSISGKHLRLELGGVPVFYFPYFFARYNKKKHSGFLTPSLDFQSGDGFVFAAPLYWHLADNYDATTTPTWFGGYGLLWQNEFRYLTENVRGNFLIDWAPKGNRYYYDTTHRFEGDSWNLLVATENVSDSDYFKNFNDETEQLIKRNLPTKTRLSYFRDGWKFVAEAVDYKNLDDSLSPPHNIVPHLLASHYGDIDNYWWAMTWEFADFHPQNAEQTEGRRWGWEGETGLDFYLSDVLVSPAVGWHAVRYQAVANRPSFVVPYFRTDAEKPIPGLGGLWDGGDGVLRFAYVYVPEVKQDDAPIFDTQALQLNTYSGFHHNRYVGGDRVGDVNFLAYGIDVSRWRNRREELFVGLSQRYYLHQPRIVLPDEIPPEKGFAEFLLIWNYLHSDIWRINGEMNWNLQNNKSQFNTTARAAFPGERFLRLGLLLEEEESVSVGAAAPVSDRLSLGFFSRYMLGGKRFSDTALAFRMRDDCNCWLLSFKVSKKLAEEKGTDFFLSFELSGLGSIGKNQYESIISDLEE